MSKADFSARDQEGKVAFFVPLWKRKGISQQLFDDYWRDVHGPVCARLPGQFQYWQFHVDYIESLWPALDGIDYTAPEEDRFNGIAELTFKSVEDRNTWFRAAAILMDDEHNLFRRAIGYNTSVGNSITYVDGLVSGDPNGRPVNSIVRLHAMLKKKDSVSTEDFFKYLRDVFAPSLIKSEHLLKLRLNLFDEVDNSRPPAAGVEHSEPSESSYQAAIEVIFENNLELELFFTSEEYQSTVADQTKYIKQLSTFSSVNTYTFVYDGKMTLAGQRGSSIAELITRIGAVNQLKDDVLDLILGKGVR